MKVRTLGLLAAVALGSSTAWADATVREIRLTLDRTSYAGACPARLPAHLVFVSNLPGTVIEDDWGWKFGRSGIAPHSFDVRGGHLRTSTRETAIDAVLVLPPAGGGLVWEDTVTVGMITNPTISNTVRVSVRCTPTVSIDPRVATVRPGPTLSLARVPTIPAPAGPGAGPTVRLPDLVPEIADPFTFRFVIRNVGDGPAGPSHALLRCRALSGGSGSKGGCPDVPEAAALYDPALDGLVVPVPGIAAGGSQAVPVPGALAAVKWPAGKYEFTAIADIRGEVRERREDNNTLARTVSR